MMISMTLASTLTAFFSFGILAIVTWQVLLVIVPMVYLTILIQVHPNLHLLNFENYFPIYSDKFNQKEFGIIRY